MPKGERDWAQLDAFEAEYLERLQAEQKRRSGGSSQFLTYLNRLARGRETFWSDEVNARDPETGRLFALRTKILTLREKVGLASADAILPVEKPFAGDATLNTARTYDDRYDPEKGDIVRAAKRKVRDADSAAGIVKTVRFVSDPPPEGFVYPVAYDDIRAVLAELPPEHAETVYEVRLSNQRRTGADGDWLEGEIRLHCLVQRVQAEDGSLSARRQMGRSETGSDVERWGGAFAWEGNRLFAVWPWEGYRTFLLRRVLIHEVAHGVAELPGYAERVRRAGSVEKFCELYAENFHRPPGRSVRLGF